MAPFGRLGDASNRSHRREIFHLPQVHNSNLCPHEKLQLASAASARYFLKLFRNVPEHF
jgi:hypothetical protein